MEQQIRLNAYHIMWLFVFFDLPVIKKKQRKIASDFRKQLLKDGFVMMQYSVYTRHCPSKEKAEMHINRIKNCMPPEGQVSILTITDKQYGNIANFFGAKYQETPKAPVQLELW